MIINHQLIAFYCLFLMVNPIFSQTGNNFNGKTITFSATDGLEITADLYQIDKANAPYIILFHQAGFSRGSYRSIAPKLNELGYNCLAIDQRSGNKAYGVENETKKKAVEAKKGTKYIDAIPDVEAALTYVKNDLKSQNIIIWGSSYSASLVIYLGSKFPDQINGILAFSPGEYFKIDDKKIAELAPNITCPVFITSGKNEHGQWEEIYETIKSEKYYFLPEEGGAHGSKALWPDKKGNEAYWKAVQDFLIKLKF